MLLALVFAGLTVAAILLLPEPMLFVVVPLLLAAFFLLPPADIAIPLRRGLVCVDHGQHLWDA